MSTVASLLVKLTADTKNMEKGFKNASGKIKSFGKGVSTAGKNLSKNLTAPLAAAGAGILALKHFLNSNMPQNSLECL